MADLKIGSNNVTEILREKYKKLNTGWVSLIELPPEKHMVVNTEALKVLINEMGYEVIYITLGKRYPELNKEFKKSGVDVKKLFFIDAISQMYGSSLPSTDHCIYTSGPIDIDSISTSLRDLLAKLNQEKKCAFLDSVTTVLLYNSLPKTLRFSQFLTDTLKKLNVTGIMVSVSKGKMTEKLIPELKKLCDEYIEINKS